MLRKIPWSTGTPRDELSRAMEHLDRNPECKATQFRAPELSLRIANRELLVANRENVRLKAKIQELQRRIGRDERCR